MNDGSMKEYLQIIKKRFQSGISTEHSYRGDLLSLINSLVSGVTVTNEPKRQKCGAPDYIIQRKEIPLGYIEAKDIGADLDKTEKTDQIKRYLESLSNLIVTDYLEFRFFQYGQKVKEIKLASIKNDKFFVHSENFEIFLTYIQNFCQFEGQTITSTVKLAEMMAKKAKMMKEVFFNAVLEEDEHNTLKDQFLAFKQILMHDLDEKTFADIYAQTITYGLFAARLHDPTLQTFSRQEASELIPKSNPFLRSLFSYVSGIELDERVRWIVDDLADIFQATDLNAITADFGKLTGQTDPFLHFYEHFLAAYDPTLRKSKGVYYTPEPVVNFIVRAVDDILKSEFNLPAGLADTSKISIEITDNTSKKKEIREVHKVQFLDPATGTGTFLAEIVKQIYKQFEGQEGIWSNYVEEHLIPRLNGFEILMAPYTMCHLKLESLLRDTGYRPKDEKKQKRLQVYLTNSLEEAHPDTGTLFASWLSRESIEANYIKKETPVMVVLGNPPYSVSSSNKGEWIQNLIADYKKDLH
ncbi:N-6 DNA methylase, partial [bacterium]|nr:N-6 DNA methylase [bacterium]